MTKILKAVVFMISLTSIQGIRAGDSFPMDQIEEFFENRGAVPDAAGNVELSREEFAQFFRMLGSSSDVHKEFDRYALDHEGLPPSVFISSFGKSFTVTRGESSSEENGGVSASSSAHALMSAAGSASFSDQPPSYMNEDTIGGGAHGASGHTH